MDEETFNASHIPGAIQLSWAEISLDDTSEESVTAWTDQMREMIAVKGLHPDQPIVVYDEGTLFAARGWWQLAYLGYEGARVLDGGLPAWNEAGGGKEEGTPALNSVEAPTIEAEVHRELLATKDEVLASLGAPDVLIVDARSADEYGKGHIPGAVNLSYTDNAIMEEANMYLPPNRLREMYEGLGMSAGKRAITYCSTGVRGSVASFALRLAGFEDVALYVGSWNEWTSDPDAPVELGLACQGRSLLRSTPASVAGGSPASLTTAIDRLHIRSALHPSFRARGAWAPMQSGPRQHGVHASHTPHVQNPVMPSR
jgi:thiosulfate/3-mercaptopyruvate sulfurtransferase